MNSVWACRNCHRPSSLTTTAWWAQRQAAEAVRTAQEARDAATVPEPRDGLANALAARLEASSRLAKLEQGLGAARTALASAQVKHGAAVAAMQEAEQAAITRLAASMTGTRTEAQGVTQGAARGQLRSAEDGLQVARGAKAMLDDQLFDARRATSYAEDRVHSAALAVLADETLEDLIELAITTRAAYLELISALGWLIRNGAVPGGDIRPNQLVRDADTAPSQWREAAAADGGMAKRLAALMA